jgi:hypothetical protein
MRPHIALLTTAAATLASAACEPDSPTGPAMSASAIVRDMPLETGVPNEPVRVQLAPVVATVDLERGALVTFLDLGDHVGIAERTTVEATAVAIAMIRTLQATPLEVYLALRPGSAAPEALLRDHQRIARTGGATSSPRVLDPNVSITTGGASGDGNFWCQSPGNIWIAGWKAFYTGVTKYREAAYFPDDVPGVTFYPGASVYYGTNTNSVTYLGVCNWDAIRELWTEVQRRINGQWVVVYNTSLMNAQKTTFYSGMPASYREVVEELFSGHDFEDVGIGAAWTLSPPKASP